MGVSNSFIGGGSGNYISQPNNAILGGVGNNDGGCANVMIAGNGIVLGAGVGNPNTLHVNGLWANGIPAGPGVLPLGTVYQTTIPSLPAPYNTYNFLGIA